MSAWIRNPIVAFLAVLVAIWLAFRLMPIFRGASWLVFVAIFLILMANPRFRSTLRHFLADLFKGF